ncbi:uncharacterized protein LOC118436447 [Folsomia candida]|uniref:uncharacterized protein LOC118436447 n=1 Tax=Folsomia candida TaxID=158441 RepID=UPI001604C17F|nr:uncharacterized protein LOC118436447 [Folsomia candida]
MLGKLKTEYFFACVAILLRELDSTNVTSVSRRSAKQYWGQGFMPPYYYPPSMGGYGGQGWRPQGHGWSPQGPGWGGQGQGWGPPGQGWYDQGEGYEEPGEYQYPHPWPLIKDPAYHAYWGQAQERGACIAKGAACDWTKRDTCCWPLENGCYKESNILSRFICKKSYTGECVAKGGDCSKVKKAFVNVCCDPTNNHCDGKWNQWQWHCVAR